MSFFQAIGKSNLTDKITPENPWTYFSMEIALSPLSYAGGLGVLAGDILLQGAYCGIPLIGVTLYYTKRWRQFMGDNFYLQDAFFDVPHPSALSFTKKRDVYINANNDTIRIRVYKKSIKGTPIYALYDPGLRALYDGVSSSDHRLYQKIVLGFAGWKAIRNSGFLPSVIHLNESSTMFAAIAYIDELCQQGYSLQDAIEKVRNMTIYTNHTLVQAVSAAFTTDQFYRYVTPNIRTEELKNWIIDFVNRLGGAAHLSSLALEVAGKLNGVSKLHAEIASGRFRKADGSPATFYPTTNGINFSRWVDPEIHKFYREQKVIDEYDLLIKQFDRHIYSLSSSAMREKKDFARKALREYISMQRKNQYGVMPRIPEDASIACWARRLADYKRPEMIVRKLDRLREILYKNNMHLIISGSAHEADHARKQEIQRTLYIVDSDEILSQRVHFLSQYDVHLAYYLVSGSDIWLNTPVVGKEACGTSWMKAIANMGILISTADGGVADVSPPSYLQITGSNYDEEVECFYLKLDKAGREFNDDQKWSERIKRELVSYIGICSGGRMLSDYLNLCFS